MSSRAESTIRKIIREELEYYFEKLEKRLVESSKVPIKEETPTPEVRSKIRKKYSNLLGSISENMDVGDPFGESIQNMGITADDIPDSNHLSPIKEALSRDYSSLLKRIESRK